MSRRSGIAGVASGKSMMRSARYLGVGAVLGAVACSRGGRGHDAASGKPSSGHAPVASAIPDAVADPAAPGTPSFRGDVLPVLVKHCASAAGCHGDEPTDSVALDLRPSAAYRALVGTPAQGRKGALRVAPGSVKDSFLVAKLKDEVGAGEGKRMPLDADTGAPAEPNPLPTRFVDATLARWIADGAPDN